MQNLLKGKVSSTVENLGSTTLDMQEAGFRLLNGAARWVWRRMAWPEQQPEYSFAKFTEYVNLKH